MHFVSLNLKQKAVTLFNNLMLFSNTKTKQTGSQHTKYI